MEEIAREAGLSLATIYQHCGGKAGLVGLVHEVRLDELIGQMEAASADIDDPFERLMAGVRAAVESFMVHPRYLQINLRGGHAWGIKKVKTELPRVVERSWQRTIDWMVPIFDEGIRRGVFYSDDSATMARTANAHVQVQLAIWLENSERGDLDETFAGIEEQMRRSFCRARAGADTGAGRTRGRDDGVV